MADVQSYYDNPEVLAARGVAQNAASDVAKMGSAVTLLPYKLREAINEKLDYNKDLITQKNKAMEDYFVAPSKARLDYQSIFNPFQREALVSKSVSQAYTPYANLQDILATRQGGISDLIQGAGANARADLTTAQNSASLLRQNYEDLLGEAKGRSDYALELERMNRSGGGSEIAGLADIFAKMYGLAEEAPSVGPKEPQPTKTPTNPNVHWQSPGGEWEYNWQYGSWVPIGADVTE